MSEPKQDVLVWAAGVLSRKSGPAHLVLEVRAGATLEEAQAAFHKIARASHPDLHRQTLSAAELEVVTSAYATVAGAYMTVRSQPSTPKPEVATPARGGSARGAARTPPAGNQTPLPAGAPPGAGATDLSHANAAQAMTPKALVYYRKAENALKRGDLKGALLQIKLGVAADPTSTFLRNALAEIDAEVRKPT